MGSWHGNQFSWAALSVKIDFRRKLYNRIDKCCLISHNIITLIKYFIKVCEWYRRDAECYSKL
ncbi:hypothetical protein D3Z45_14060 [Lachnospiraceae bacterium]|nr:hypothetical protein [Lachnospiraceae bacterium]